MENKANVQKFLPVMIIVLVVVLVFASFVFIGYLQSQQVRKKVEDVSIKDPCTDLGDKLKVLYPNGGETFYSGQSIQIKWLSCGETKNHDVYLALQNNEIADDIVLTPTDYIANSGTYNATIPANFSGPGIISLVSDVSGKQHEDTSDANFIVFKNEHNDLSLLDTSNWKSYTIPGKVTFKYPNDWNIEKVQVVRTCPEYEEQLMNNGEASGDICNDGSVGLSYTTTSGTYDMPIVVGTMYAGAHSLNSFYYTAKEIYDEPFIIGYGASKYEWQVLNTLFTTVTKAN